MADDGDVTSASTDLPRTATAHGLAVEAVADLGRAMTDNLGKVVRGKPDAVRLALVALLSGHHLLLEDVPGVGKTLLAKALAQSVGGSFGRVQGTPDLLPADVTGVSVLRRDTDDWEFRPGPLFHHVVLVDEINRATPRTQSALLAAMEERQVTVDGTTWPLPAPFFVVATQNPIDHAGTFPLVEGQRDRFGLLVELGPPPRHAEKELLLGVGGTDHLAELGPVCPTDGIEAAVGIVRQVHCAPAVADYVLDLADGTRHHPDVRLGASPRASIALLHSAKANAALSGRPYVSPDDVRAVAVAALSHRLVLAGSADGGAAAAIVERLLETVPTPKA
ncbi:MAG: AAA family ATPase [Acidimicrobiales bacterium]